MPKLSKRIIDAALAQSKEYMIWDATNPGFGLRVFPSGKRSYIFQYRAHGRTRKYSIGLHGAWTVEQARKKAEALRHEVNQGRDPSAERKALARDISVADLCDAYLKDGCDAKKPSTLATDRGRIERHIKPVLGHLRVKSMTSQDVEGFMNAVIVGKTAVTVKTKRHGLARVRGGKGTAARTMGLLGAIFAYAVKADLRADNPVHGIRKPKDKHRERFLTREELRRLGCVLDNADILHINPNAVPVIKLLLLTGCRKSEVLSLQWSEVDFDHSYLLLHDSKTGPRKVTLPTEGVAIIKNQPHISENPYVFASTSRRGHFVGLQKAWEVIRTEAGLEGVRIHDLRHSFASILAEAGTSLHVISTLLGHRDLRTTQIYAHLVDEARQQATEQAAATITANWTSTDAKTRSEESG